METHGGDPVRVPVSSLQLCETPRLAGEDARHIRLLAEAATALPPILVHRGSMRVIDGRHRVRVAQQRGEETIEARFFDGTDEEAFVAALVANRAHGLPLTLADREAAAERLIDCEPHRSDRAIAEITGLSPGTVGELRRRTGNDGDAGRRRVGRDGRVRPLDGADGRRVASEVIARRPESSLREIARMAGISPATARDVRERLRRGDDPLPRKLRRPTTVSPIAPRPRADREAMLDNLNRDPSLRFTDSGRTLLRWLFTHAREPNGWEQVVDAIPPHCAYIVAEVARDCADSWAAFADQLQERLQASA
jgi:ParB-like chromosome segregation protein Spo0J